MPILTLRCLHGVHVINGQRNPQHTACPACVVAMSTGPSAWKVIYVIQQHHGHRVRFSDPDPRPEPPSQPQPQASTSSSSSPSRKGKAVEKEGKQAEASTSNAQASSTAAPAPASSSSSSANTSNRQNPPNSAHQLTEPSVSSTSARPSAQKRKIPPLSSSTQAQDHSPSAGSSSSSSSKRQKPGHIVFERESLSPDELKPTVVQLKHAISDDLPKSSPKSTQPAPAQAAPQAHAQEDAGPSRRRGRGPRQNVDPGSPSPPLPESKPAPFKLNLKPSKPSETPVASTSSNNSTINNNKNPPPSVKPRPPPASSTSAPAASPSRERPTRPPAASHPRSQAPEPSRAPPNPPLHRPQPSNRPRLSIRDPLRGGGRSGPPHPSSSNAPSASKPATIAPGSSLGAAPPQPHPSTIVSAGSRLNRPPPRHSRPALPRHNGLAPSGSGSGSGQSQSKRPPVNTSLPRKPCVFSAIPSKNIRSLLGRTEHRMSRHRDLLQQHRRMGHPAGLTSEPRRALENTERSTGGRLSSWKKMEMAGCGWSRLGRGDILFLCQTEYSRVVFRSQDLVSSQLSRAVVRCLSASLLGPLVREACLRLLLSTICTGQRSAASIIRKIFQSTPRMPATSSH